MSYTPHTGDYRITKEPNEATGKHLIWRYTPGGWEFDSARSDVETGDFSMDMHLLDEEDEQYSYYRP